MVRVSMKDVAEYAGVSATTVSHVINETRYVSAETRQRVLAAIEALDYHPSAIARGLATNSTQAIGLVVSDITNPFWPTVTLGVEYEISQYGYHTIFCNTDEDPNREADYLRLLLGQRTAGLLIGPTGVRSEYLLKMVAEHLPIVFLDRGLPGVDVPLVCVDNEGGAYAAIQYMLAMGHTRIGVLMGIETVSTQVQRVSGYKRALQDAGLLLDEVLIVQADNRFYTNLPFMPIPRPVGAADDRADAVYPSAVAAVNTLFDLPEPPTAIFVSNNQMMLAALQAIAERGLHCPDDISLVAFDDPDWARFYAPPLTVVRQPTYKLGQMAAQLLMRLINEEPVTTGVTLPVELVIRESVKQV